MRFNKTLLVKCEVEEIEAAQWTEVKLTHCGTSFKLRAVQATSIRSLEEVNVRVQFNLRDCFNIA